MKLTPSLIAISAFLALAACGQSEEYGDTTPATGAGSAMAENDAMPETSVDVASDGLPATEVPPTEMPQAATGSIVDVAQQAGDFTTLINIIDTAGFTDKLEGPGPFTVFAPTDEAFAALPEGQLDDLMRPANREKLIALLEYHLLPSKVTTADVARDVPSPASVEGSPVDLETDEEGKVTASGANIVTADIMATNGVIHIVDKVMMPPTT